MPSAPSISVIIATYNQADKLAVTLRALAELDLSGVPAFEVVIADNGSGPDVTAIIADFAATAPFPVKALREHRQGSSYARNTAIKASSGDLFMCIDQDCVVEPNWVQAALLIFSDTLHKLAGGRVELFDPTDQSITTKTSLERELAMHARDTITIMLGANFAFGRSVIERIGVFDVRLGAGSRHKPETTSISPTARSRPAFR
jgi:glycosyltransferase involved in cell wall biosynthesis